MVTATSTIRSLFNWKLFLLLTFHPALLYLDHVHFQYNGMLLGLLMLSLAALMHANNKCTTNSSNQQSKRIASEEDDYRARRIISTTSERPCSTRFC